nr:unnamed protein product [Callosobruchus analis]
MAIVPSWQQLPPQHAAIQQPLISEAEWGRPLLVDSSTILQEQRPVFPVDVAAEVYNPAIVEQVSGWGGSSKRGSKSHHGQQATAGHHSHHHLMVPSHLRSIHHDKKEQTQLSPVKKRVKEGTPPSDQFNYSRRNYSPAVNAHWPHVPPAHHLPVTSHDHQTQTTSHHHHHHHGTSTGGTTGTSLSGHHQSMHHTSSGVGHHMKQHTITINDTPSPAVSVITISDSEDETAAVVAAAVAVSATIVPKRTAHADTQTTGGASTQTGTSLQPHRKNVISCVSVPDSDNEDRSSSKNASNNIYNHPVIKNEPCQSSSNPHYASQKKRLLAKAQSECLLNVATKQEPSDYNYLQHCTSACKEPPHQPAYQYEHHHHHHHHHHSSQPAPAPVSSYQQSTSSSEKRLSWAAAPPPPAAHGSGGGGGHSRRHSSVAASIEYAQVPGGPIEYTQPPAAHTTRDGREQHLLAPPTSNAAKGWVAQPVHPSYRCLFIHSYLANSNIVTKNV